MYFFFCKGSFQIFILGERYITTYKRKNKRYSVFPLPIYFSASSLQSINYIPNSAVLDTLKTSPFLNSGNITCLENAKTPLSVIFPGSQNAFFSFFFTAAALSNKSILESSSDEDIFAPAKPGTAQKANVEKFPSNGNRVIYI